LIAEARDDFSLDIMLSESRYRGSGGSAARPKTESA
jgi:hypothetical protein